MGSMNRIRLVVLLVVGVTLLASTPAQARKSVNPFDWGTQELTNVGDEPDATGEATLTDVWSNAWLGPRPGYPYVPVPGPYTCTGTLTVECRKLTPGATYWTPAGTFIADHKGKGMVTGQVSFLLGYDPLNDVTYSFVVDVVRLDADATVVLSTVW